jgi:hypothetical protein
VVPRQKKCGPNAKEYNTYPTLSFSTTSNYYENNNTIHYIRGRFLEFFPPTTSSYLIELKPTSLYIHYINCLQMIDECKCSRSALQSPNHKRKYIFPDITLMFHLLKFKMSSKCTLVHIQLSSTFACDGPAS